MSAIELSVVLCAHNPRDTVLARVLAALDGQTLPKSQWELLLVDNASNPPLEARPLRFPQNAKFVCEGKLGLTPARLAGFAAARGSFLVLVDDDTVLGSDYLEVALNLLKEHPEIGAAGGRIAGEFAHPPPGWARAYVDLLAIRDFGDRPMRALVYNEGGPWVPCGAGMALRSSVASAYAAATADPRRRGLDRVGTALSSCGDSDLALTAPDIGLYLAYEPKLSLTHVIPAERLRLPYLSRLTYSVYRDGSILARLRGRQFDMGGWRYWAHVARVPFASFSLSPRRWLLRAASALGQIKGRSVDLGAYND